MKEKTSCVKVKILFKDCIFPFNNVLLVYATFFTQFFRLSIKFEAKYDI
jgi:hypothetical protein